MKCKEIQERLLKGMPTGDLNQGDPDLLAHINKCQECQRLIHDLNFMRTNLHELKSKPVPDPLDHKIMVQCHDELDSLASHYITQPETSGWLKIPPLIWIGISILIVLTFAGITPIIGDLLSSEPLSKRAIYTLIIIGQNALMLLLSPVIIQKFTQNRTNRSQLFNKFSLQNGSGDPLP